MEAASTLEDAESEVESRFKRMRDDAIARFKERPLFYTGVAAGAGFLLGGGLVTSTTLRILRNSAALMIQVTVVPYVLARLRDMLVEPQSE